MEFHEEGWAERMLRALSGEPDPDPRILNSSAEAPRPVRLAWCLWFAAVVAIIVAVIVMSGCAEDRYLSAEQDAEMRAQCEPQPMGCAVMPMHEWLMIEKLLQRLSGQQT